jgi:imidazole glycerol-phosphate synthase subunit HisF
MVAKRIVACLDVAGGRVVKGVRFKDLRDAGDPVLNARRYCRDGVDELVMLDVSATQEARSASLETVARIAEAIDVPLTVGGGVRNDEDVARYLEAGADRVAVNSAALAEPSLIDRCAQRFGAQCVVLSIDAVRVREGHHIATHGGSQPHRRDALDWALEGEKRGAGEVLLTSIDRDGTRSGFDLDLIELFAYALRVPFIASGGARGAACFAGAFHAGADAALGASLFHDGDCRISDVKRVCREQGLVIRP